MSKKYWFKRRRYGYGWIPTTWQGWSAMALWLIFVIMVSLKFGDSSDESPEVTTAYVTIIFISVIPLVLLAYLKGPRPKWRWGKSKDDDPKLDI